MNMNKPPRRRWPLQTLIEMLPVVIALTAVFSYSSIRNSTNVALVTPLSQVLQAVPVWVVGLMGLVCLVSLCGMGWLIYLFSRAPVDAAGRDASGNMPVRTTSMAAPAAPQRASNLTGILIAILVVAMVLIALLTVTALVHGPPAAF